MTGREWVVKVLEQKGADHPPSLHQKGDEEKHTDPTIKLKVKVT